MRAHPSAALSLNHSVQRMQAGLGSQPNADVNRKKPVVLIRGALQGMEMQFKTTQVLLCSSVTCPTRAFNTAFSS